ncbi:MAG: cytochrome C oxidase subunit IV family protein [Desulfuromonadales bacterium]
MAEQEASHIVPHRVFIGVWIVLLILTGVTVAVAQVDLGPWNIWMALTVACVKSSLVLAFFMHLKYESPLFMISLLSTLAILAIFIGFTFFDVLYR